MENFGEFFMENTPMEMIAFSGRKVGEEMIAFLGRDVGLEMITFSRKKI
jgi:hypothetical protein